MTNHLKRIPAPKTWSLNRKKNTYVVRPNPGPHPLKYSLPLGIIIRDILGYGQTIREVKKLLNNKTVLVDGKRKKDHRLALGLFDVLSFPDLKESWRVLFDLKGRLVLKKIKAEESQLKPCRIMNKTRLSKNIQLNLHDGKNILADLEFKGKVGDSVLISLPDQKIKETLELKKDAFVYVIRGKQSGDSGILQEIKKNQATYQKDKHNIETLKKYLLVLGTKKPLINID
tara:strand:- start:636 stop:1322 length:687 start_codon:yes stop_codon:yes gene_type:complete